MQIINALLSSFALVDTEPPVISLDMGIVTSLGAWNGANTGRTCTDAGTCDVGIGCIHHTATDVAAAANGYTGQRKFMYDPDTTPNPTYRKAEVADNLPGTPWVDHTDNKFCEQYTQSASTDRQHSHYRICEAKAGFCALPDAKAWDHHDGDLTSAVRTYATLINMDNQVQSCTQTYGDDNAVDFSSATANPHCSDDTGGAGQNCPVDVNQGWTCHKEIKDATDATAADILLDGKLRSEWLIDYEVEDKSGNRAKSLSFSIIYNDVVKPYCNISSSTYSVQCGIAESSTTGYVSEAGMASGQFPGAASTASGAQQWHTIGYNDNGRYLNATDDYEGSLTDSIQFSKLTMATNLGDGAGCLYRGEYNGNAASTTCYSTSRAHNDGSGGSGSPRNDDFCDSYHVQEDNRHPLNPHDSTTARCPLTLHTAASSDGSYFPADGAAADQYVGNMRTGSYTQAFAVLTGMVPRVGVSPDTNWRRFYDAETKLAVNDADIDSDSGFLWNADGRATSKLTSNSFELKYTVEDHAGIFGQNGNNNVGDSSCDGTITFTVTDITPPEIAGTTNSKKTLQECKHDSTVDGSYALKTQQHTTTDLGNIDTRTAHTSGDPFSEAHYGVGYQNLHKFYHDQISCTDDCSGMVWTQNPWTAESQGRVLSAKYPIFKNSSSDCEQASSGYGLFCTNGARYSDSNENTFMSEISERSVTYYCRDYAGNSVTDSSHIIHVVDTSPPFIALSHLCHDIGVHDSTGSDADYTADTTGDFSSRYNATSESSPHTRTVEDNDPNGDFRLSRRGNTTTDKHYRAHNSQLNFDWDHDNLGQVGYQCINWNEDITEASGAQMYVSAGYSKELAFLDTALKQPSSDQPADFDLTDTQHIDGGWSCRDTCDEYGNLDTAAHWTGSHFPTTCTSINTGDDATDTDFPRDCFLIPGTYTIKYTCTDKSKNEAPPQERTIYIEDHKIPIISVLGSRHMSLEATNEGNYVDDGATCSDQVDGMISQNVEVSGAVVNLTREGTYVITYSCADSAGYEALRKTRTVTVTDCNCPSCYMTGDNTITREASFPYEDEQGWCTDDLDASNPVHGDTALTVNVEKTGVYYVTYFATDTAGNWNYQAQSTCRTNNREGDRCDNYDNDIRTVHIVDTLKPVIALNYDSNYFQYGDATDTGIQGNEGGTETQAGIVHNPVDKDQLHRVSYMAETEHAAVSGWMIGAIASAVTGLALLGYSRNTVATTVPV